MVVVRWSWIIRQIYNEAMLGLRDAVAKEIVQRWEKSAGTRPTSYMLRFGRVPSSDRFALKYLLVNAR